MKERALKEVEDILDENGYDYSEFSGCFDVAAIKKQLPTENILLLKVLENVDSFMEDHAKNLSIVADNVDGNALLVGNRTSVEKLQDSIIYERFGVHTVSIGTLELIVDGTVPKVYRFRGGLFSEINPEKLKAARNSAGLTQGELALKAGVTKKNIYEHEARQMKIQFDIAEKIESILDEELTEPARLSPGLVGQNIPKGNFEKTVSKDMRKLGISTSIVYKAPFNIIATLNDKIIISDAEADADRVKKNAPQVADFADITRKFGLAITKDEVSLDIPSLTEHQLKRMHPDDIRKLLE